MAKNALLESILRPQEQWAMSSVDNEFGMSLPEYHPEDPILPDSWDKPDWLENLSNELDVLPFSSIDESVEPLVDYPRINSTDLSIPQTRAAFNKFMGLDGGSDTLTRAQKAMFQGALLKTVASASDFFSRATGILAGQAGAIRGQASNAIKNYQNQMAALDNQVLYLKNQLSDRFNKMVDTNIMNMAAKNLRVSKANVLDLTRSEARDITEDMRMAESNARLRQIALQAGQKSAKESSKWDITKMWTGFVQSALKLGIMWETGGGTGESWGDLYKGYRTAKKTEEAIEAQEFNKLY